MSTRQGQPSLCSKPGHRNIRGAARKPSPDRAPANRSQAGRDFEPDGTAKRSPAGAKLPCLR